MGIDINDAGQVIGGSPVRSGPGVIQGFNNGIEVGGAKLKVLGVTFRNLGDAALNVGPCAGSLTAGETMVDVGQAMDFAAGGGLMHAASSAYDVNVLRGGWPRSHDAAP